MVYYLPEAGFRFIPGEIHWKVFLKYNLTPAWVRIILCTALLFLGRSPDGQSIRSGANFASANWIVYRMADVLLMKAEALSQLGQYEEAINLVNEIRNRALVQPITSYPLTASGVEDIILEERAKELAFEGKRWFDLLRMGRRNNYDRKEDLIQILIRNVPATQKRVLATKLNDPNGWYFPIHEDEIENNAQLVQNPYYDIYERN